MGFKKFFKDIGRAVEKVVKTPVEIARDAAREAAKGAKSAASAAGNLKVGSGKSLLSGAGKGIGSVNTLLSEAVKDVGTATSKGLGQTISETGRLVDSKDLIKSGGNVTREGAKGFEVASPLITQIAGNALTGGAYGAVTGLGGMAAGGPVNPAALGAALGSLTGYNPQLIQALASGAQGDIKGSALASLGSLGGMAGLNPSLTAALQASLQGDTKGTALAALTGVAGAAGMDPNLTRGLSGAVTGNQSDLAYGLLGASGAIDPKRLAGFEGLTGGKLTGSNLNAAFGGLGPSVGAGNLLSGFGDFDLGLGDLGLGEGLNTGLTTRGLIPEGTGDSVKRGVKDIVNSLRGKIGGSGSNFQAGREPAGEAPKSKSWLGNAWDNVTGAVQDFVGENSSGLGTITGLLGTAGQTYLAEQGLKEQRDIIEQQKRDLEAAGGRLSGISYDPNRYAQQQKYLQDIIAGGGYTAKQKLLQQQGNLAAGRSLSSGLRAGLEQQARLNRGGAASSSGASLAQSMMGAQSAADIVSRANLEREASAVDELGKAYETTGRLSSKKTAEEADLANVQEQYRLSQLDRIGLTRGSLSKLEQEKYDRRIAAIKAATEAAQAQIAATKTRKQEEDDRKAAEEAAKQAAQDKEAARERIKAETNFYNNLAKSKEETQTSQTSGQTQTTTSPPSANTPPITNTSPAQNPPTSGGSKPPVSNPAPTPTQTSQAISGGSYVIQRGDTLSKIAKNLGYSSWQEAYEGNKDLIGSDANKIIAGKTLRRKDEIAKSAPKTAAQQMNTKYTRQGV